MKIKNVMQAGKAVITQAGVVVFDSEGFATEPAEAVEILSKLEGYEEVEAKKQEKPAEKPAEKKPEEEKEEAPKKASNRRTSRTEKAE